MSQLQPHARRSVPHRGARSPARASSRRRASAVGALLASLVAIGAVVVATLGLLRDHDGAQRSTRAKPHRHATAGPVANLTAVGKLASAVSGAAVVPDGSRGATFFGGLDTASTPIATIQSFDGGTTSSPGTLPVPLAASGAAVLDGATYLFGGSETTLPTSDIVSIPSGASSSTIAGSLPQPTEGAAVAASGSTAYVIGGYDGTSDLDSIVSWSTSAGASTVASLPQPVVDAAAVADDGAIYVIGGADGGAAIFAIYRFDPATRSVTKVGELPIALTQPAAAVEGGRIIVLGGYRAVGVNQSSAVYSFTPATAQVKLIGLLPVRLAGAMAISLPGEILLAGGVEPDGQTSSTIYRVELASRSATAGTSG
ncbi:MAG: kelch repeat-containing protein [Solirubrobacteraceae bacterium]|jgi:hypothetical protein